MWKLAKKSALVRLIGGIMAPNRVADEIARSARSTDNRISKGGNHGNRSIREEYTRIRPSTLRRVERGSRRALVGGGLEGHLRHHLRLDLPAGAGCRNPCARAPVLGLYAGRRRPRHLFRYQGRSERRALGPAHP